MSPGLLLRSSRARSKSRLRRDPRCEQLGSQHVRAAIETSARVETDKPTSFTGTAVSTTRRGTVSRSEEHTSELQSRGHLVCRLLLEKNTQRQGRLSLDPTKKRRKLSDLGRPAI